jgi:hypothetical protein
MRKFNLIWGLVLALLGMNSAWAVDSYRFMHVTIETPWAIFLFLLVIVLFPFVLTAILHWHFSTKKKQADSAKND